MQELSKRIIVTFVSFLIIFLISYFSTPFFIEFLKSRATEHAIELNIFKLTEAISIYMKVMFFQSIIVTVPIFLIQVYAFIRPAIDSKTRRVSLTLIPIVSILFLIGVVIGFKFIIPLLLSFFLVTSKGIGLNTIFGFNDYFNFVFLITIIFGMIFQLPVLLSLLTYLEIISVSFLIKFRKFSYLIFLFVGISITPPDFISDIMITTLLFGLYEFSIIFCKITNKQKTKVNLKSIEARSTQNSIEGDG